MPNETTPTDLVRRFFSYLDEGEFEKAAEQFTDDATFSIRGETFKNRDGLLTRFKNRGYKDYNHEILEAINEGNKGTVYGKIVGDPQIERVFIAYCELTNGKISFYIVGLNE